MRFLFLAFSFLIFFSSANAQSPLFFSEYIEGSGNNKYLELFNPSATETLDLSEYRVELFSNGSSEASDNSVTLSGTLAPRSVFVIANSSGTLYDGADISSNVTFYNGNDALAIKHLPSGNYTDIFGRIGEDPGSAWSTNDFTTGEQTLIRKSTITSGVTQNPSSGFPTLETEWEAYPQNTADDLGQHTFGEVVQGTSDVIPADTWEDGQNFDYLSFVGNTFTNGQLAGTWVFRDGGEAGDQDDLPTVIQSMTLTLSAFEMIDSIRVQRGERELLRVEANNSEIQFSPTDFSIADNQSDSIQIYITYAPPVVEGELISVVLSQLVVSEEGSSGFVEQPSMGYVVTSPGAPEVTATQQQFISVPETVLSGSSFEIKIAAIDTFESIDTDNTTSISIALREGDGSISVQDGETQPFEMGLITFSISPSITSESFALIAQSSTFSDIVTPFIFIQEIDGDQIGPGLKGDGLISYLDKNFGIPNDDGLGYNQARDFMYSQIDNRDGFVRAVYTGVTIQTNSRGDAFNKGINTEHTWPQGLFGSSEPMRGDIHHLFPTLIEVNGARGSLPFDEIPDTQTDSWFISASGQSSIPNASVIDEYSELDNGNSFEPREDHKGNVARAIFYFWTVYQDKGDVGDDASFFNGMKDVLYEWHQLDPVDQLELDRSLAVEVVQGNKNPFIHDASLVQRAYFPDDIPIVITVNLSTPAQNAVDVALTPDFNWEAAQGASSYRLQLSERSSFSSTLIDTVISENQFQMTQSLSGTTKYYWKVRPSVAGQTTSYSSVFEFTTVLDVSVEDGKGNIPTSLVLDQNYPNPFNPTTTIRFALPESSDITLEVFSMLGQNVATLHSGRLSAGWHSFNFNAQNLSSGMYIYRLQSSQNVLVRQMVLIK